MNEAMKTTILEWANEYKINVSDEQVEDLIMAIDALNEMESMPFMFQGK
ncbi:hypothetical protein [Niallia taxi]